MCFEIDKTQKPRKTDTISNIGYISPRVSINHPSKEITFYRIALMANVPDVYLS